MSAAMEEETVDWGDVEAVIADGKADPSPAGGDDVISLGGVEEMEEEEEIAPPTAVAEAAVTTKEAETVNGKAKEEEVAEAEIDKGIATPPRTLPPGWKLQEARSGGAYYFNTVTGKTTWDFPVEEADAVTDKGESSQKNSTSVKLGGIQIKGTARGNIPSSEDEDLQRKKKRDAESQAKEEPIVEANPQKRRRSNTPEKKRESWSASPEPASKLSERLGDRQDRGREARPDAQGARGWGRRPGETRETNASGGPNAAKPRRYDNEPQRETGYDSRRRVVEEEGRDRSYQRGNNGNYPAPSTGQPPRSSGYPSDKSRSAYEDRRPSARDGQDRGYGRSRETSPVSRRRDEYNRGNERESNTTAKDSVRSRDAPTSRDREPERREVERERRREPEPERGYAKRDVRESRNKDADQGREKTREDRSVEQSRRPNAAPADRATDYQKQGYGNQGYNYMDRRGGPLPPKSPYPPADAPNSQPTGYGPQRGYHPRGYRPDNAGPASPSMASYPSGGQVYGPRGGPAYPQGSNRPVRPWIAPEEKQKRWWNKNSGEKKAVNPEAMAESEGRASRGSSSKPSTEPATSKRDR